jgi:hypothetical protein
VSKNKTIRSLRCRLKGINYQDTIKPGGQKIKLLGVERRPS